MVSNGNVIIGDKFDVKRWDKEWLPIVTKFELHSAEVSDVADRSEVWMKYNQRRKQCDENIMKTGFSGIGCKRGHICFRGVFCNVYYVLLLWRKGTGLGQNRRVIRAVLKLLVRSTPGGGGGKRMGGEMLVKSRREYHEPISKQCKKLVLEGNRIRYGTNVRSSLCRRELGAFLCISWNDGWSIFIRV